MKQLLLGFLLFVFVACAPTASAPTNVSAPPTPAPTLTFAPTQLAPTATRMPPTNVPIATTQATATVAPTITSSPTATLSPTGAPTKIVEPAKGKIAFTSNRESDGTRGGTKLFLMNSDGSEQIQIIPQISEGSMSNFV